MTNILESLIEGSPERAIEGKENISKTTEHKSATRSDKTFWIVVESLAEQGHLLPNEDIIEIKKSYYGQIEAIILKFRTNVTLVFSEEGRQLLAIIKNESFTVEEDELQVYKDKYYNYALLFLQEQKEILKKRSHLAKVKLDRIGI
jgi:hypothetical protein